MKITCNETYVSYQGANFSGTKKTDLPPVKEESVLAEAIRLYKGYKLTGLRELTAGEKEEIRNAINAFMEESGFFEKSLQGNATDEDFAALNDFIKELCIQYGYPRDFYEFVSDYIYRLLDKHPQDPPFTIEIPPEHELKTTPTRPMLASFQPISPLQFLCGK